MGKETTYQINCNKEKMEGAPMVSKKRDAGPVVEPNPSDSPQVREKAVDAVAVGVAAKPN